MGRRPRGALLSSTILAIIRADRMRESGARSSTNGLDNLIGDLVVANRILANEGVLDAYGHVSVRHPSDPKRYLISRSRSPQWVDAEDILEYSLEGDAPSRKGETPYTERHI